jgi:glycosyltransferase involved in cell wall biosynthesis
MSRPSPKVSVALITYNHADFIAQAIEGVLMQETNFDYELVIGEDDSSDGTREIVKSYKEAYPDKIRLLLNDRKDVIYIDGRPTGRWNFINTLQHCNGQYVAWLDGDDYWIDSKKLQKQGDFLDDHPECAICFHAAEVIYENSNRMPRVLVPPGRRTFYGLEDLLRKNFVPGCSSMFRNGLIGEIPDWFLVAPVGDKPLLVLLAERGRIGYLDEVMGVYRKHSGGVWSGGAVAENMRLRIRTYEILRGHLGSGYDRLILSGISYSRHLIAHEEGNYRRALVHLIDCLVRDPLQLSLRYVDLARAVLEVIFPGSYPLLRSCKRHVETLLRRGRAWLPRGNAARVRSRD